MHQQTTPVFFFVFFFTKRVFAKRFVHALRSVQHYDNSTAFSNCSMAVLLHKKTTCCLILQVFWDSLNFHLYICSTFSVIQQQNYPSKKKKVLITVTWLNNKPSIMGHVTVLRMTQSHLNSCQSNYHKLNYACFKICVALITCFQTALWPVTIHSPKHVQFCYNGQGCIMSYIPTLSYSHLTWSCVFFFLSVVQLLSFKNVIHQVKCDEAIEKKTFTTIKW